jgi:prefoldin alpha subunit
MEVKQQLEQELDHLAESFQKLRQAQAKFRDCTESVKKTSQAQNEDKSMLVPLTSSLYVPGKMTDVTTFMVDVGTGYYVEKQAGDAIKFFDKKVATLTKNLTDLEGVVNSKTGNLRAVEDTLKRKVAEQQQQNPPATASA